MNWLYYLAEANLYLSVFYLAYCLFLNKETYYLLNRAYLIFSCVVSFILPVLQIGALKPVENMATNVVAYTIPVQTTQVIPVAAVPAVVAHAITLQDGLWYAYLAGAVILLLVLFVKLYHLFRLMRSKHIEQGEYKLVYLEGSDTAFSFFNYLFIGTNAPGANTIIRHELVHIRQKHSTDIIFMEVLKIINWFNPFIYLLQNSLKTVHEYIADEQTIGGDTDALAYSSFLVNNAYGTGGSSITHSFFNYNLLKRRIIMLNQQRSGNWARLKYLVAVPICGGLLCASTLAFSKTYGWVDIGPVKIVKVNNLVKVNNPGKKISFDKKMKIPIPSFTNKGYDYLFHHINESLHYNPAENDKGAFVVVGFTVNNDHKLSNIKIDKSGGSKFDAEALNAFRSYNLPVKDKPGNRKAVIVFYNGQNTDSQTAMRGPAFVGYWVISDWAYNVQHTSKGYEYDQYAYSNNNKMDYKTVVYEKNGDYTSVFMSSATPTELKLLKDKYGYTFPKNATSSLPAQEQGKSKLPPPPPPPAMPTMMKLNYHAFANYIQGNAAYPEKENKMHVNGLVVLNFNLNSRGMIGDVSVLQSAGHDFDEAALNALKSYKKPIKDKEGTHSIGVIFEILGSKVQPTTSTEIKKQPGYVGELIVLNQFPPPVVVPDKKVERYPPPVVVSDSAYKVFYRQLQQTTRYPAEARQNNTDGRTYAVFTVDDNHKIQNITMLPGPPEILNKETLRALQAINVLPAAQPGIKYTLPVTYVLANNASTDQKVGKYTFKAGNAITRPNSIVLDEAYVVAYGTQH